MTSRICQNLGRSRYSHCWSKKMEPLAQSTPKVLDGRPHQRADDDDEQRAEQPVRQPRLPLGFAAGDDRGEEDAGGEERRRGPQQRQLHVPGPRQVERQDLGQVEAEEVAQLGAIVLDGAAQQRLAEEEHGDDEEEPGRRLLRRGDRHLARLTERQRRGFGGVPADLAAPPPVEGEQCPEPGQQGDERHRRPDEDVGRRRVVDPLLRWPVVGVGVVVSLALRRAGPGGPAEERGQVVDFLRVGDHLRDQAVFVSCRCRRSRRSTSRISSNALTCSAVNCSVPLASS